MLAQFQQRIAEQPTRAGKIVLISRDARLLDHDLVEQGSTLAQRRQSVLGLPEIELVARQALVGPRQVAPEYGIAR